MKMKDDAGLGWFWRMYGRLKKWILYGSLLVILVVLGLGWFLGAVFEGVWAKIVLSAAVLVIGILIETMGSLEKCVKGAFDPREFAHMIEAVPVLQKIVEKKPDETKIEILAATGGTTMKYVLPALLASSKAEHADVFLHVVDPDVSANDYFPDHWPREAKTTVHQVQNNFKDGRTRITLYQDKVLPPVHGILVNGHYLVIGMYNWTAIGTTREISGAQQTHRFMKRGDPGTEDWFALFEEWARNAPYKEPVIVSATP